MDVLTTALTAAITAGATGAAYQMLKTRLAGKSPRVDEAIADLEDDPGSLSRQFSVSDALAAAGLAGDRYLRAAARNLLEEVERRRPIAPAASGADAPNHAVLQVFFATDRQQTGDPHPARQFGGGRGELAYGSCEVSIPHEHQMGAMESPSLLRLQFRPDPDRHVVLLRTALAGREPFFASLAERIAASPSNSALLFVHGYRVSFEDAARRTGQIAHDLQFPGIPVFYSWPSQGRLSGYMVDETNIEWTQARLLGFLVDFLERTTAEHVYLLAHSMGNRAMTRAAAALIDQRPDLAGRLREIILTAPDIDAEVFRRDIAPALAAAGNPVTLYASSADSALEVSQRMHGYPRAGDSGDGLVVVPGVETVDASKVDTSFIAHSYFAQRRSALADMYYLITRRLRAAERFGLHPVDGPAGRYWTFDE
ncbi:esterase/lipase superfamily enzyme [Pseudoduganella lurida]|uniref:Esterase/lipase superfamily enzyme n=1 Tax=Pseudoduganella lurida TaxID=1036180 RepID=A0A562RJ29_9BURK|nr:alpha/beta hydrolase [Pseudoduganella lurida]TWI69075.1 esterase/lipase superfamily enzyme [Pseudoduganella lurida]